MGLRLEQTSRQVLDSSDSFHVSSFVVRLAQPQLAALSCSPRELVYFNALTFATGLRDLDSNLGPYPYESLKRWVSLTNHVSENLVSRYNLVL